MHSQYLIKTSPSKGGSGTGGQGQFLTRILAQYQAILDIATYLSLNKLFGFHGKKASMRSMRGDDDVV